MTGTGLIAKFARQCLAAIDFAEPYFFVTSVTKVNNLVTVTW